MILFCDAARSKIRAASCFLGIDGQYTQTVAAFQKHGLDGLELAIVRRCLLPPSKTNVCETKKEWFANLQEGDLQSFAKDITELMEEDYGGGK